MTYAVIHFLHIVGALGMAAAYAVEAAGLAGMRRSTNGDEARAWLRSRRWVLMVGPASIGLVLATGIYTIVMSWGWMGWIIVSLASVVAVALIGGLFTGIPMARIGPAIENTVGDLPGDLRRDLKSSLHVASITTRIAITLGIVLLMVRKPDPLASIIVMGLAATIGMVTGVAFGGRVARSMTE